MLFVPAFVVDDTVTVTLGVIDRVPVVLVMEEPVLKSIAMWMGVPATSVSGNGEVVMLTEDCASAGESVQGEVVILLLEQLLVPSVKVVPELFNKLSWGLEKVIVIPE